MSSLAESPRLRATGAHEFPDAEFHRPLSWIGMVRGDVGICVQITNFSYVCAALRGSLALYSEAPFKKGTQDETAYYFHPSAAMIAQIQCEEPL